MMDKECYLIFVNISELDNTVDIRKDGNVESNETMPRLYMNWSILASVMDTPFSLQSEGTTQLVLILYNWSTTTSIFGKFNEVHNFVFC